MAIINQIQKALAGIEDLLVGQGTVNQVRAGQPVNISKVNASNLPYSGDIVTNDFISIAAKLNSLDADKAPAGALMLSLTGGLTTLSATQFKNNSFDINGALTSNLALVIPDGFPQLFVLDNLTTGNFTLTVKHATTSGLIVKQGDRSLLYTTGTVVETVAQTANVLASDVVNIPSGFIVEATVQGALNGLEARKLDSSAVTPAFIGGVAMSAIGVVPVGYLECNGAAVSRITYANLFSQLGTLYGAGDGSTTFGLPDLRGEFVRGWDHGRGVDAGRGMGTSQVDMFKSHSHSYTKGNPSNATQGSFSPGAPYYVGMGATSGLTGGGETRPRNIAMMYIIKV